MLCSGAKSRTRRKATQGGSKYSVLKEAAPSPSEQSPSHTPFEAATGHEDGPACPQQVPSHVEPTDTVNKGVSQAPEIKTESASLQQEDFAQSQAALQAAQAKKQKAARRRAAKSRAAKVQIKPGNSSDSLSASSSAADSFSQKGQEEQVAVANAPAPVSARPVTQSPEPEQTLHKLSSEGQTAPWLAPAHPHPLQQSTSEHVHSAGSSISSPRDSATVSGPCLPDAPDGHPASARPAPVRLSRATLQHSNNRLAPPMRPPLDALLPVSAPQPPTVQVKPL